MKNTSTAPSFFDQTDIEIPLTYAFLPDVVMRFFMRLQMNKEAIEANQAFLGLTQTEREAKDHENNVALLSSLATKHPEGVPGYKAGDDVKVSIYAFFSGDNPMKKKVCVDVLNKYFRLVQPKEYL